MSEYTLLEESTASSVLGTDYIPVSPAAGGYKAVSVANLAAGGATITSASTLATGNPNYGIMQLSSAHLAGGTYPLSVPAAGVYKTIIATIASTANRIIGAGTGATFDGVNNQMTSTAIQSLELVGVSTIRWAILSNVAAATASTTGGMVGSTA